MTIQRKPTMPAMKKRGGIGSMGSGKPTARPKATGRTVYKSRTTIPTRRVAKPTQTPRQKAIAGAKARGQAKIAAIKNRYNSLTPAQKTAMKQKQQAKALSFKQRQATNKATPTKTTGTLGNPTSTQKKINNTNMQKAYPEVKQLSAPQKQMPRTTSSVPDRLKKIVGSTVARRRKAIAVAKARSQAKIAAAIASRPRGRTPYQNAALKHLASLRKKTVRRPTGRTVYKSRTTIPTRRRRK